MVDSAGHRNSSGTLRERAEALLERGTEEHPDMSPDGIRKLVYELHTHQIELEMQNESLRLAQNELMEVHERVSDLYEFAPIGYITITGKGMIQEANLTISEMLKMERSLFAKRTFSSFIVQEDQDIFYDSRRRVYTTGKKTTCELRLKPGRATQVFWVSLDIAPVCTGAGAQTAELRIAVSDVTEKHLAQEVVAAAAADQHEFEKRLEQTQRLESLGVMAGGIAHDFNNILQIITGNIDLAVESLAEDAECHPFLKAIATAAARATDLTDQMLAYSGGGTLEVRALDLSVLTREMADLLSVSHKKKAVLVHQLEEHLPAVEADPTQLRQVIMNLITNASDAIGDKGGTITLRTGVRTIDGRGDSGNPDPLLPGVYVYLQVSDSGCGMDQNTLDHMFDPFFTTKFKGRGLGLAAVRGIALSHRGEIRIESKPKYGTTATVLLPAHGELPDLLELPVELVSISKDWKGGGKILVVDDEASIRALLSMTLKKCGYEVQSASNGKEALAVVEASADAFDCVLLDLTMPDMDGMEAGARLRTLQPGIKIILLSGYRNMDIQELAGNPSFDGFLKKPVGYVKLVETVRSVMTVR